MTVGEFFSGLIAVAAVVGFGYFLYTKIMAAKKRKASYVPGGGGGRGDGGREQQVEK